MIEPNRGSLVGIGIGPGDADLLTLRAVDRLKGLDTVFTPRASDDSESLAYSIARDHIPRDCEVVSLLFPMTRSSTELESHWEQAALLVVEHISRNERCGFLTLGDPLLFSTFIYLIEAVKLLAPDVSVEIVPGVSAPFAAASRAGVALGRGDESVALITGEQIERLARLAGEFDTIIIMKVGKRLSRISAVLDGLGLSGSSVLAQYVGQARERVVPLVEAGSDEKAGYMSTIIVRTQNE